MYYPFGLIPLGILCYMVLFHQIPNDGRLVPQLKQIDLKDAVAVATDEENHMFTFTRKGYIDSMFKKNDCPIIGIKLLNNYMSSEKTILIDDSGKMVVVAKIKRINITVTSRIVEV